MLDIENAVSEICNYKNQLEDAKLKIRNEIKETKTNVKIVEEICYLEYEENDGYCNDCCY